MMTRQVSLSLFCLVVMALLAPLAVAQSPAGDLLLYDDNGREPSSVTAYNPATGEKLELPIGVGVDAISTSGDGRIAYVQENDIWVLDVLNAPNSPTKITRTPDEAESRLRWTPDGRLLEYQVGEGPGPYILYTYDGNETFAVDYGYNVWRYWNEQGWYVASHGESIDERSWYVWNGQERIDLSLPTLPASPAWQKPQWAPDNHLFIIVGYREQEYGQPIGPTDVFYWDGSDVREVDHPLDDDTFLVGDWSADGRLTLYTSQDYFDRWYVWDGVSFTPDGVPDTSALTPINGPAEEISDIDWMPDGRLAIVARGDPEADTFLGHVGPCAAPCAPQVYVWDSETVQQVTANDYGGLLIDVHDNGRLAVFEFDGLRIWGVTVFDSSLQPVFQSDGKRSVLSWSADGNFAYCSGIDLLVWNGQDATQLSMETYSKWLLSSSPSMVCSMG